MANFCIYYNDQVEGDEPEEKEPLTLEVAKKLV